MFEKFVGNIWFIFLKFEKLLVIQVLTYYNFKKIKKKIGKAIWKSFAESLKNNWENFNEIHSKISGN